MTQLRSLVAHGDGAGLVAVLSGAPWSGRLAATHRGWTDGGGPQGDRWIGGLARDCVVALGERRWDGDQELAEALEAALGAGPTPMLRPLPVDLAELAMILEGDPVHGGGRVDLRTGEVWPQSAVENAQEVREIDADVRDPWAAR